MNATLIRAEFATVRQLFQFKEAGQRLKPFPGYSDDQWGIKAHNRPWIEHVGNFQSGERIAEVGGAYSLLPEYLAESKGTESWIIDDFGAYTREVDLWQRWGDPDKWIAQHPKVRYLKKPLGLFDKEIPDAYFDCVFSVSTLEHIPASMWSDVIKDMLRITKPGGRQFHAIDIPFIPTKRAILWLLWSCVPFSSKVKPNPLALWQNAIKAAQVKIPCRWPRMTFPFDRSLLMESADVVFRFYPPTNRVKEFPSGGFSLLLELRRH